MEAVPVKYVIADLDGTLLDTETLCVAVAKQVLALYDRELTPAALQATLGKRPLECWTDVAEILKINVPPQQLLDQSEPLLRERWGEAQLLPGALRLVRHLAKHNIQLAIATSTPRDTFNRKMANKPELRHLLRFVVCGDEVLRGKPHPDVFLEAARLMGAEPGECLVLEDAVSGVEGARRAGMRCVVIPSLVGEGRSDYPAPDPSASQGVVEIIPSLLAFQPELYGLPAFTDTIQGVIPMDQPICIKGPVTKGFGRGSRELGIPTANIDPHTLRQALSEAVTGIYTGYASVGTSGAVYPHVMSIGWNPYYGNKEKTAEPWLLSDQDLGSFYGEEIRLVVCAYIRPEANFTSLQALIDRIHEDARQAKAALQHPSLHKFQHDSFLQPGESAAECAAAVAAAATSANDVAAVDQNDGTSQPNGAAHSNGVVKANGAVNQKAATTTAAAGQQGSTAQAVY